MAALSNLQSSHEHWLVDGSFEVKVKFDVNLNPESSPTPSKPSTPPSARLILESGFQWVLPFFIPN